MKRRETYRPRPSDIAYRLAWLGIVALLAYAVVVNMAH
jgi:hypothetical protein